MNDWLNNICWLTDSYKVSHFKQYPPGIRQVYSYFESRAGASFPQTTFFGLQYFLKNYLQGPVVTKEKIEEAEQLFHAHFFNKPVFNRPGWEHILKEHGGHLPIRIRAVPEGMSIDSSNVLMTVENTDPAVFWLTNYLETLLVQVWYSSTVATQSRSMKQVLLKYLQATGDPSGLNFKLHDFGFRGVTCPEQAAIGGAAHLVNFQGTDTVAGLVLARKFYSAEMPGFSIPAAEHSTITSWGEENEVDAMRNMLEQYPDGFVACVSDSFDIYRACSDYWGTQLKQKVLARDGVLVVRPDSGDPLTVVNKVLNILGLRFGFEVNAKGFKVLNPKVRVIQGDGIDRERLPKLLEAMKQNGWSADNIAFGSGGGLLQKLNRDTQRFAFKCSSVVIGEETRDVYKRPITDGDKASKRGRLKLKMIQGAEGAEFQTVPEAEEGDNLLTTVFENGQIIRETSFDEIRRNAQVEEN